MIKTCKCSFTIENWDEIENDQWQGGKLTRTLARKKFIGEIDGTAELEAIMLRMSDEQEGVMSYVGVERINCTLDGRTGSFILIHNAEAINKETNSFWKILPGSGAGELKGISGTGSITPDHDFILDYELN